jgi:hypothetical protein
MVLPSDREDAAGGDLLDEELVDEHAVAASARRAAISDAATRNCVLPRSTFFELIGHSRTARAVRVGAVVVHRVVPDLLEHHRGAPHSHNTPRFAALHGKVASN